MREEYKFKGKRLDTGIWVCGDLIHDRDKAYISKRKYTGNLRIDIYNFEVDPDTVEQYTGINDQYNYEIYSGDILENRFSENKNDWKRWQVVYSDGRYVIVRDTVYRKKPKHAEEPLCADTVRLYGLVCIGNIHEHMWLMEEGEKQ